MKTSMKKEVSKEEGCRRMTCDNQGYQQSIESWTSSETGNAKGSSGSRRNRVALLSRVYFCDDKVAEMGEAMTKTENYEPGFVFGIGIKLEFTAEAKLLLCLLRIDLTQNLKQYAIFIDSLKTLNGNAQLEQAGGFFSVRINRIAQTL